MAARGIRNNNPGNIRHSNDKWQGKARDQPDEDFIKFESPEYGIRALARVLIRYYDAYDLDTVRKIISRWAPPVENNTLAYVTAVAEKLGVEPDDQIDVHDYNVMEPLVRAIIEHENGRPPKGKREWYAQDVIDEGLRRAGVIPPREKRSAARDPETIAMGAAGVAGTGGAAYMAYDAVSEAAADVRAQGRDTGDTSLVLIGAGLSLVMTLVGAGVGLYFIAKRVRRETR